ncbi:hypothetical protein [Actinomadura sp. 3N508]|uniref:hypothetical protein n=1 Tax=Actinomadura sp. 3N508 TaxID=3375153 RepID=UPI0037A3208D
MQNALDALEDQAETTLRDVRAGVDVSTLTEIVHALESLRNVVETFNEVVAAVDGRAKWLREAEPTERRDATALKVMDAGLASLRHAQQAAVLVQFLLGTGGCDLFQVADGEV